MLSNILKEEHVKQHKIWAEEHVKQHFMEIGKMSFAA